jgi:hypothetical protein
LWVRAVARTLRCIHFLLSRTLFGDHRTFICMFFSLKCSSRHSRWLQSLSYQASCAAAATFCISRSSSCSNVQCVSYVCQCRALRHFSNVCTLEFENTYDEARSCFWFDMLRALVHAIIESCVCASWSEVTAVQQCHAATACLWYEVRCYVRHYWQRFPHICCTLVNTTPCTVPPCVTTLLAH